MEVGRPVARRVKEPPALFLTLALAVVASLRTAEGDMWRAFFWSIGIFACLLGGECLVLEKAVLTPSAAAANNGSPAALRGTPRQKEIVVPDWAPWSLFSFGAVTLIYTVTLPKRANAG